VTPITGYALCPYRDMRYARLRVCVMGVTQPPLRRYRTTVTPFSHFHNALLLPSNWANGILIKEKRGKPLAYLYIF